MSYQLKVLKDHPIGFWMLDETSGTTSSDSSGCGNNGTYTGSLTTNIFPLVPGGVSGSKITTTQYITLPVTKDYYGSTASGGFANKYTSDNDFSLEVWIYPTITTTNTTTIFADPTENIGIFWEKGNIVFKLDTERLDYTVEDPSKAMHVVAVYSNTRAFIYVNGRLVSLKNLTDFLFTNTSVQLQVGPTANASDSFIVDAPAVYRYALPSEKILNHFTSSSTIPPIQIVESDQGILIIGSDNKIKKRVMVKYPNQRPWATFFDEDLMYNEIGEYISVVPSDTVESKTVVLTDAFSIPSNIGLLSSKVEWAGTEGVTIEVSVDGGTTYVACENGKIISQYKLGGQLDLSIPPVFQSSFNSETLINIRITLSTTDASKYIPKLYYLVFSFYDNKTIYAENGPEYISPVQPDGGSIDLTVWDYDLGSLAYSPLHRNSKLGITPYAAGFAINTEKNVRTVEMMFTPISTAANYLYYGNSNSYYSWNGSGVISKGSEVSAFYVNGVDRTSATNISSYLVANQPHHIVIVLSADVTTKLWFNVKVESGLWTNNGPRNSYSYLGIYQTALSQSTVEDHYDYYIGRPDIVVTEPSFAMTETGISTYNNDWIVLETI